MAAQSEGFSRPSVRSRVDPAECCVHFVRTTLLVLQRWSKPSWSGLLFEGEGETPLSWFELAAAYLVLGGRFPVRHHVWIEPSTASAQFNTPLMFDFICTRILVKASFKRCNCTDLMQLIDCTGLLWSLALLVPVLDQLVSCKEHVWPSLLGCEICSPAKSD